MGTYREMSGITFYVANNDIHQQSLSQTGTELPIRAPRAPYEPSVNAQNLKPPSEGINAFLPLMDVIVDVSVIGSNSRTVLTQIFSNPTDEAISESRYIFPLYDGSTVINFRYWVGNRPMIEGVVKPKEEARTIFKKALAEKKIASLLIEETPEIFEISLGNIPPESVVRVEILYLNELKLDVGGEGLLVTVPTSIAPRYGKAPVQEMFMRRQTKLSGKGLRIQVDITAPDPLHVPESRTHPIKYSPASVDDFAELADTSSTSSRVDSNKGRVSTAHPFPVLDRDFVLLLKTKDHSILEPRALMEHCETSCNTAALQVSLNPLKLFADAERTDLNETEIIFIIDRSGSMTYQKIEMLKKSLRIFLEKLLGKRACSFNICSFGSGTQLLWPQSMPCAESSLKSALDFLSTSCKSDMGGTELEEALRVALDTRSNSKDVKTQFIVMTDGEVWDYNGVMSFVKSTRCKHHDKVRYFAVGIGDEVSHQLIEGIAREGGGLANVIPVGPYGDWKSGILRILDGAMVSDNWELSLRLGRSLREGSDSEDVPHHVQAPFRILSLHAFTTSRVYFLFKGGQPPFEHVIVEGKSTDDLPMVKTIPIENLKVTTPIIHQLAAKAVMKDLEAVAGEETGNCSEDLATVNKQARDQAIEIGLTWNIIGKYTSFVGVDSTTQEETITRTYKCEYLDLDDLQELQGHDPFDSLSFLQPPLLSRPPSGEWGRIFSNGSSLSKDDDDINDENIKRNNPLYLKCSKRAVHSSGAQACMGSDKFADLKDELEARYLLDDDEDEKKMDNSKGCSQKQRSGKDDDAIKSAPTAFFQPTGKKLPRSKDCIIQKPIPQDVMKIYCTSGLSHNGLRLTFNSEEVQCRDIWIQLGLTSDARLEDHLIFRLLEAQHPDGWFQIDIGSMAEWKKYLDSFFEDDCKKELSDHLKGGLRRSLERHLKVHPERHGNILITLATIQQLQSLKFDVPGRRTVLNLLSNFQPNCSPQYVSSTLTGLEAKCSEWEALEDKAMNTVLAVVFIMDYIKENSASSPFLDEKLSGADLWLSQNLQDEELKEKLVKEASCQFLPVLDRLNLMPHS